MLCSDTLLSVVGSLVIVFTPDSDSEIMLIFGKVKAYKNGTIFGSLFSVSLHSKRLLSHRAGGRLFHIVGWYNDKLVEV